MRYPDSKEIIRLTEKLKTQGDITEQEADNIRLLFSRNCARTKLNPKSVKFDAGLFDALIKFAETALGFVKQEKFGIFISSFPALPSDFSYYGNYDIYAMLREIKKNLPPKDRIAIFNVSFDRSERWKKQTVIINETDIFKNTELETWVSLDYGSCYSYFSGYRPDCFGFFRRRDMNKIFKDYTDLSVVSDPFLHFTAEFFFNHAGYNIINTSDILSCDTAHKQQKHSLRCLRRYSRQRPESGKIRIRQSYRRRSRAGAQDHGNSREKQKVYNRRDERKGNYTSFKSERRR